jgi:hypothetical protein
MVKVDDVWSATTSPLKPEIYWYWFIVDGQVQLDPLNGFVIPNYVYLNSNVIVHGTVPQLWEDTNVPHGELHHHFYGSKFASGLPREQRDYYVAVDIQFYISCMVMPRQRLTGRLPGERISFWII